MNYVVQWWNWILFNSLALWRNFVNLTTVIIKMNFDEIWTIPPLGCHNKNCLDDVIKRKHFRVTGPLWGNQPVTGGLPSHRPVTGRCDIFYDLRLYKRSNKQSGCRWFETPSHSSHSAVPTKTPGFHCMHDSLKYLLPTGWSHFTDRWFPSLFIRNVKWPHWVIYDMQIVSV